MTSIRHPRPCEREDLLGQNNGQSNGPLLSQGSGWLNQGVTLALPVIPAFNRHPRAGGDPRRRAQNKRLKIPAFAGMTSMQHPRPCEREDLLSQNNGQSCGPLLLQGSGAIIRHPRAGGDPRRRAQKKRLEIPAFAGMTSMQRTQP